MPLHAPTRALLVFLKRHPQVRARIAAPRDATILYAGELIRPAWKEIEEMKRQWPQLATRKTLPEVLVGVKTPGQPFPDLHAWALSLDALEPYRDNGFVAWRALSGIFAGNARGAVSFVVGAGVTRTAKVFAATEVWVLARNPHIDETTRDLLAYYRRCIEEKRSDLCVSYVPG